MKSLIAIPVYNEERFVEKVIAKVRHYAGDVDILVIDDGSTDKTQTLIEARSDIHLIQHDSNRGYGQAMASAFRYAVRAAYDVLITIDCDEQHEPERIPDFLAAAQHHDIVSGSRYLLPSSSNDTPPPDRHRINMTITQLLCQLPGLAPVTDAFCGFKAYQVRALKALNITESGYAMPMQFWAQVAAQGLDVTELPVRLIYNDPNRHFGHGLDEPERRLTHYMEVLERELAVCGLSLPAESCC